MAPSTIVHAIPIMSSWRKSMTLASFNSESATPSRFTNCFRPVISDAKEFPPIDVFSCRNIILLAQERINVVLDSSRTPIKIRSLNLDYMIDIYLKSEVSESSHSLSHANPVFEVGEQCVLLAGWGPQSWGHFIVEFLPRLLVLKEFFRIHGPLPLYISEITPQYIVDAIHTLFADSDLSISFFSDKSLTSFRNAIIPPFINHGGTLGYNPYLTYALSGWLNEINKKNDQRNSSDKIYISRKHKNHKSITVPRAIINEDEVIDALTSREVKIIAMEELSFTEKIMLMKSTSLIIGGWGSGLLNSLLCNSSPDVVSLGIGFNPSQFHVCDAMNQGYYEIPTFDPNSRDHILTDIRGVSQYVFVDKLLDSIGYLETS